MLVFISRERPFRDVKLAPNVPFRTITCQLRARQRASRSDESQFVSPTSSKTVVREVPLRPKPPFDRSAKISRTTNLRPGKMTRAG
eukprot:4294566-Prymnesium_polylepis.1